jgi:hypothetical protein
MAALQASQRAQQSLLIRPHLGAVDRMKLQRPQWMPVQRRNGALKGA